MSAADDVITSIIAQNREPLRQHPRCANGWCGFCETGKGVCVEHIAASLGVYLQASNQVFARYKASARKRGYSFELTSDQLDEFLGKPCAYCGDPPSNVVRVRDAGHTFSCRYQGVDRVDNTQGYQLGNVVPCCSPCNVAKKALTKPDFIARARRIAEAA